MRKRLAFVMAVLVVAGLAVAGFWYVATTDDEATVTGTCAGATYVLTVESEAKDRVDVGFELTTATVGEEWQLSLRRNDEVLSEGTRTSDEDGEIEIETYAVDDDAVFAVDFAPVTGASTCNAETRAP